MGKVTKIEETWWRAKYYLKEFGWSEEKYPRCEEFSTMEAVDKWIEKMERKHPDSFFLGDVEPFTHVNYIEDFGYEPSVKIESTQRGGHLIEINTPEPGVTGKFEIMTEMHEFVPVYVYSPKANDVLDTKQKQQAWRRLLENANLEVKYQFIF